MNPADNLTLLCAHHHTYAHQHDLTAHGVTWQTLLMSKLRMTPTLQRREVTPGGPR